MHSAHKAIGRQPLCQRIRFDERATDLLWLGCQDAMQTNSVGHLISPFGEVATKTFKITTMILD
jgi:hypothetical protein